MRIKKRKCTSASSRVRYIIRCIRIHKHTNTHTLSLSLGVNADKVTQLKTKLPPNHKNEPQCQRAQESAREFRECLDTIKMKLNTFLPSPFLGSIFLSSTLWARTRALTRNKNADRKMWSESKWERKRERESEWVLSRATLFYFYDMNK